MSLRNPTPSQTECVVPTVEVKTMLENYLHNHDLPVIGADGQLTTRRATCAEAERHHASHVSTVLVPDGQGGQKRGLTVVNCHTAEVERQELLTDNAAKATTIERLTAECSAKDTALANAERLMGGAIQVIFGLGPALQGLLSDDLGAPELTADRSAVKLTNAVYTVIIDVFGERIIVRASTDESPVPEKVFRVYNGYLDEDGRTLLLGHVTRIKAVAVGADDPVREAINLVSPVVDVAPAA